MEPIIHGPVRYPAAAGMGWAGRIDASLWTDPAIEAKEAT
jgi:hypothetical protein